MNALEQLRHLNRWWDTEKVDSLFLSPALRDEFSQIEALMDTRRVLAIIGPRRAGKSTLLYQTINGLLQSGVNPAHILFFTGDNPGLYSNGETIGDIINLYVDTMLHKSLFELESRVYVFIDEIHFVKDWQLEIKSLYDLNPRLKFVISGSSSTQMFHGAKDSLLGRITDIRVLPLGFDQFLRFNSQLKENFDFPRYEKAMPPFSVFENPEAYYEHLTANRLKLSSLELSLNEILRSYLQIGGYPEYFTLDLSGILGRLRNAENQQPSGSSAQGSSLSTVLYWQKILADDIISKGLYRDIVSFYRITSPVTLERLLYLIAANSGGEYAYAGLGEALNIDTTTATNYIHYLAQVCLVTVLENYSPNGGRIVRKNKKIYLADNGIRNAILRNPVLNPGDEGHLAENAAVQLARAYSESNLCTNYYWRDKQRETDIIMDKKTTLLPIEVKFRNQLRDEDLKGLRVFMEKYQLKTGLMITKNTLNREGGIVQIPLRLIR